MKSKQQRYIEIQKKASELYDELDALHTDMQESLENVPENLQGSDNYTTMEERVDGISDQLANLQEITEFDWSNPNG